MAGKDIIKPTAKSRSHPEVKPKARQDIENLFQKNGAFDGKLFHSQDRATYTFIFENEVIALHLDISKRAIFLKGHRITDANAEPHLVNFLGRFKKALMTHPETKSFVQHFEVIVEELLKSVS